MMAYDRDAVVSAARRWAEIHGEPPRALDWDPARARREGNTARAARFAEGGWPTLGLVQSRFGSFGAMLEAAGFTPRRPFTDRKPRVSGKPAILQAIRRWAVLYGEPPSLLDWDPSRARRKGQRARAARYYRGVWPSTRSVLTHFGSFSNAIVCAGLTPRSPGERQRPQSEWRADALRAGYAGLDRADFRERLAQSVRTIAAADDDGDAMVLHAELVRMAGSALSWADSLEGPAELERAALNHLGDELGERSAA